MQSLTGAVGVVALAFAAVMAEAGGPVEITACTTITEPGSYVVVNNLTPSAPGDRLVVGADFVTVDLGGFVIRGNAERGGKSGAGVRTPPLPPNSFPTGRQGATTASWCSVGLGCTLAHNAAP